MMRLDKITRAAFDALEDVKARDIVVFDVKKMTAIFDKVIVATGESNRQCRALANRVQEMVKAAGGKVYGTEGEQTGEWVLVDIGGTVIHIMQPAIRQYYNLEELWAPQPKTAKSPKAPKGSKPAATQRSAAPRAVKAAKPRVARAKRSTAA
jgi:ribosome-associated protein